MGKVSEELLAQLHPLEIRALPHLKDGILLRDLAKAAGMQEVEASRAVQWLENKGALRTAVVTTHDVTLGANAHKALREGMPEYRFLRAVQQGARNADEAAKKERLDQQEIGASIGILKKRGLIDLKPDKSIILTAAGKNTETTHPPEIALLKKISEEASELEKLTKEDKALVEQLRARKEYVVIKEQRDRKIALTDLGRQLAKTDVKKLDFAERLTPEDLQSGAWKEKRYRAYDVTAPVPRAPMGKEHFVQEAIDHVSRIWVEMGFTEMTGTMAQSAFWDLDALFVPQDHPAREMQDTFYLARPQRTPIDRQAFERVRAAHENGGGSGSLGWRYRFSREESERLLLRTHTTVLSARTLWAIREGKLPYGKYFAVGKVFRNEAMDWKHLFEFHQVEGIVVDKNVNFAQLLTYLRIFFGKMGYPDIRLRPSHFPYTEPSVEIDVWHPKRNQWVELGGAGMFRPEVTKALLGEEVPVLAWGPGFERIIVDYFQLADLRDLYRNDIKQLRDMRRFSPEGR